MVQNNTKIAQFVGVNNNVSDPNDLLYHESWDWLMNVIHYIEQLGYRTYLEMNDDHIEGCTIIDKSKATVIENQSLQNYDCFEIVYDAVILFIENYNMGVNLVYRNIL